MNDQEQKAAVDKIRAATLGAPVVRKSAVLHWNGVDIEVFKPTLAEQRAIDAGSMVGLGKKAKSDNWRKGVQILLCCARVPGTDIRPFTRHDIDAIEARGDDDFVGAVLEKFAELTTKKEESPEVIEKNSEGDQTAAP